MKSHVMTGDLGGAVESNTPPAEKEIVVQESETWNVVNERQIERKTRPKSAESAADAVHE